MSGEIARVMKDIATKIGKALGEDLSRAEQKLLHTTGDNLERSVTAHVEHDASAAASLERAAKGGEDIPTVHGGGDGAPPTIGGRGPSTTPPPDLPDTSDWPYQPPSDLPPGIVHDYRPYGDGTKAEYDAKYTDGNGHDVWPPSDQFPGGGKPGTQVIDPPLPPGYQIDRFGDENGGFLGRDGDPLGARSLPTHSLGDGYHRYVVTGNPLPEGYHVEQAEVAPWFAQDGGGVQYRVIGPDGRNVSVARLRKLGWLDDYRG